MGEILHPDFAASRRVTLAREASFELGRLEVHPSTRQVSFADRTETVEPRVLQVLVALARADGEVVSKDELIHCCWDGRIVGEDAINRVISRIRHIAQDIGGGSFHIDTIRGVGYRLVESQEWPELRAGVERDGGSSLSASRRPAILDWIVAAIVIVGILAGAGLHILKASPAGLEPATVAVLPFKNMSAGDSYFAEGVAEEIANRLAREPQFKVAGRTSSEMANGAADLRDIGRRLHVNYVLEGSVRSAGGHVRVDVSLLDARNGMRLWSQKFSGSLDDIFAIQDSIGREVATHVKRRLVQIPPPRGTTTTRGDVYSLYLTARGLIATREPAKLHSAIELLRQAVRLDPNYAPAWAQLAQAMKFEWQRSRTDPSSHEAARREWLRIARHALQLAPHSADAHLAMCSILASFTGETPKYDGLVKYHCERAAQLDPNRGEVLDYLAQGHEFEGDHPRALAAYRRLYAVEPLWWHAYGGLALNAWRMGYRDEARLVIAQTARDVKPFSAHIARAALAAEQGDWSEALKWFQAAISVAEPGEKEMAEGRMAVVMRALRDFERARGEFFYYEVDDDLWRMWHAKAPSPQRVAELGKDPVKLWPTFKMNFLARTLVRERRSAELVRLYDRRFGSPEQFHATMHEASAELIVALRDVGRRRDSDRMAALAEADAQRIQSYGRVPYGFHFHRSAMLAAQGRRQEAIAALEKAVKLGWFYNNRSSSFRDIAQEPVFREISSDPRFQRIRTYFASHAARERREAEAGGFLAR